ncbi:MAG: hypothetical protein HC768_23950 [Acaryochloris sp. CRU_2_0]|nr:hypothetical protein [Acaryochloris sp. CRU_2_0]
MTIDQKESTIRDLVTPPSEDEIPALGEGDRPSQPTKCKSCHSSKSTRNYTMNEANELSTNQVVYPEPTESSVTPEIAKAESIRDLVTPEKEVITEEIGDRSPTQTERPLSLELIQETLNQSNNPANPVETERSLITPESLA